MNYFITAIHTDSGKTLVSAILTHALQADYWKPVQCGYPRDTDVVASLVNNDHSLFYEEAYLFQTAASPHQAAAAESIEIDINKILLPDTTNNLVIEGAGGVLVPLNRQNYVIDLAARFDAEIVLVANIYLGSINHTLLTAQELQRRDHKVKGIIFNGPENAATREIILEKTGYRQLLHIQPEKEINQAVVTHYAIQLFENWDN